MVIGQSRQLFIRKIIRKLILFYILKDVECQRLLMLENRVDYFPEIFHSREREFPKNYVIPRNSRKRFHLLYKDWKISNFWEILHFFDELKMIFNLDIVVFNKKGIIKFPGMAGNKILRDIPGTPRNQPYLKNSKNREKTVIKKI